jgi:ABC-2 type transport system permease protein
MKTMKWLVRREFWEHKGMFFWAPVVVSIAIALLVAFSSFKIVNNSVHDVEINGEQITQKLNALPVEHKAEIANALSAGYLGVAMPLLIMMSVVLFFYLLGAMYDERRDRSILFWKSLPVSDQSTVLSKIAAALVAVPLIYTALAIMLAVFVLLVLGTVSALKGVNLFPLLLGNVDVYLAPLQLVGLLPVYMLWALPTVGWLMMVSAWAKSKVFLWAVGVPLIVVIAIKWMEAAYGVSLNSDWFIQNVILRGMGSLIPGIWMAFERIGPDQLIQPGMKTFNSTSVFLASWSILLKPSIWVGAVAGGAMIFASMRLRRFRDEG